MIKCHCFPVCLRFGGYSLEHDGTINGSNKIKTTVWFNNKGFHSLPSFYNGYSNAVLRTRAETEKNGNPEKYGRYFHCK